MRNIVLCIALLVFTIQACFAIDVAVTIDDIPSNGSIPTEVSRLDVVNKIIKTLKKHHISHVYGFLNANKANPQDEVIQQWMEAGHLLGNHTFSHIDLAQVSAEDFIANIRKDEPMLKQWMKELDYHYFRYPFLAEGNTLEKRNKVREYLLSHHYQVAPVTVDFFEYAWNDPYVRCLKKHDKESIEWIKENYLKQALNGLTISHELSTYLFNRDIKNVLLIHINLLTAEMLDKLLTEYERQGVKFISLSDALADDIYKINPNVAQDRSYTFLNQIRLMRGLKNPEHVVELYDSFEEEKLNSLCQ